MKATVICSCNNGISAILGGQERQAEEAGGRDVAGQGRFRIRIAKKVVAPAARRRVVQDWVAEWKRSEPQGCRLINVSRATVRYQAKFRDDSALRSRMNALAEQYPRYGYPTLHAMLKREGSVVNPKRTIESIPKKAYRSGVNAARS